MSEVRVGSLASVVVRVVPPAAVTAVENNILISARPPYGSFPPDGLDVSRGSLVKI